jgi:anaerobic magnesium-protoporphyrin IX monomethyl ester cyclase
LSSHIHGEGEYVSIQHGYTLMEGLRTDALKVAGGLQPTANPSSTYGRFPNLRYLLGGESDLLLRDIADAVERGGDPADLPGVIHRDASGRVRVNPRQALISDMDAIPPYDYSLFEDQVFLRPYNGEVVRAADYEMSRGCIYSCSYCVETVIQAYYGFTETTRRGTLTNPKRFLRCKSADRVMSELANLAERHGVTLVRCQDTNFLTIERDMLYALAERMDRADLPIRLYIETRPEGINPAAIALLKRLKVDGVGMGIELSTQAFRENNLNRFSDQAKIISAFKLLRESGIRRTAYNIIGLPEQHEDSIIETIEFNRMLDPDNVTVAFYSPYLGTQQQMKGTNLKYFEEYEYDVDSQLRTVSRHTKVTRELLEFYKSNFVRLVRDHPDSLEALKYKRPTHGCSGDRA